MQDGDEELGPYFDSVQNEDELVHTYFEGYAPQQQPPTSSSVPLKQIPSQSNTAISQQLSLTLVLSGPAHPNSPIWG